MVFLLLIDTTIYFQWQMIPKNNTNWHFDFAVISRNILTDPASSVPTTDDVDGSVIQSEPLPPDINQSGPPDDSTKPKPEITIKPELPESESVVQDESQSGNNSMVVAGRTDTPALKSKAGAGSLDIAKPAHADEM